jgi:hypothetical protein
VEFREQPVVREHAFRSRYDTPDELELLNRRLASLRANFSTPTRKAVGHNHHRGRTRETDLWQASHTVAAAAGIGCA